MTRFRTTWPRAFLLTLALFGAAVQAQTPASPPPLAHFFDNAGFGAARLSPDARLLAVRVGARGKRESLAVFDLSSKKAAQVASFDDADIGHFEWISDTRLLFDSFDKNMAQGDVTHGPGLYAVNADGSELRQLALRTGHKVATSTSAQTRRIQPWNTFMLAQAGSQDSHEVYVSGPPVSGLAGSYVELLRLDTLTGRAQHVPRPSDTKRWLLDHKGEPRITVAVEGNKQTIHYRDPQTQEWRPLTSFPAFTKGADAVVPLAFGPDGTLYVRASAGKNTSALHTYDLAAGKVSAAPVMVTEGYDFAGKLVISKDKLLGVHYGAATEASYWFDDSMKALQADIDKRLPGTVNRISVGLRPQTPWVLVESYSDIQPRLTMLFNTDTKVLSRVGAANPQIDSAQMGRQHVVRYKARDGLEIPALLTLPAGAQQKNLPLVVMVHGGPYVRGTQWGWSPESQFLASRGYAVLEPEFRGSTGYGHKHFQAGMKQWGLAMQDDIADGAKWAIAEGIVDPKRICIAGASYGGYATLMGLVKDPDLFKCGIDYVGVTDINLLFDGHWSFKDNVSDDFRKYGMPELIGNPKTDAAQFDATSPLKQAARITQPLLLAYGGEDRRVPLYHGKAFHEAVSKTNKNVEWVVYENEGHGWFLPATRLDFWGRVEKFLERNIGQP